MRPLDAVPPRYRSTYFAHIWSNGYSAGYYAYLWSEMLDDDAFEWFTGHGGLTRANGDRFRAMVLSKGSSEDFEPMYERWRGGNPTIDGMLRQRGLVEAKQEAAHWELPVAARWWIVVGRLGEMKMARLVVTYKTPKDKVAFDKYYFETHVPLTHKIPGLRKFEVNQGPAVSPVGDHGIHRIAILHFDSMAAIEAAFASPEGQAAVADLGVFAPEPGAVQILMFETRMV